MKCPFRKQSLYEAQGPIGSGCPSAWQEWIEFEDCIGEECAAFGKAPADIRDKESEIITFCCLCHSNY